MSLGTFSKCCYCGDLRLGSFIIGYLLLIVHLIHLTLSCIHLVSTNERMHAYMKYNLMNGDLAFFKLILSFGILLLIFELLITIALLNGLHKKIQDQVQMFYVGGFVFEVLRLILVAVVLLRYAHMMAKQYDEWQWFTFAMEMMGNVLYIYFLFVIRSYYFKMRNEEISKQWNVFAGSLVQLTVNK